MGVKLALAGAAVGAPPSVSVPTNIGVPAQPVTDSGTEEILSALRAAVGKEVALVDLESGQAWWETRLLVLLAGAARRRRPSAVVFLATAGGVPGYFQGWGEPRDLLSSLLEVNPAYRLCYTRAEVAAAQWALVEPASDPHTPPAPYPWMTGLATQHPWMVYKPGESALPNPFAFEQFLAAELGREIESQAGSARVSAVRLRELFTPVLRDERLEEDRPEEERVRALLKASGRYVAITRDGVYQRLLAKEAGLAAVVLSLARPEQKTAW